MVFYSLIFLPESLVFGNRATQQTVTYRQRSAKHTRDTHSVRHYSAEGSVAADEQGRKIPCAKACAAPAFTVKAYFYAEHPRRAGCSVPHKVCYGNNGKSAAVGFKKHCRAVRRAAFALKLSYRTGLRARKQPENFG